ncbi:glycerate kinase [Catenulispora acidiphila DSM 44928]|uniref:Glycerate kinase n=1 Tax=Catenulispora acidiphila (strain DSM 44928 / JCM 14897 / NBRC 102108 / NRRL B-24433 / ID139908) TaxID=479433 RepID=C7PZS3_CATAD|nr:glycerate kinase [Catenulispora acidiphila]ACU73588.1 glycerate kinase [Catenulispora acidiphila DSM 44928]
MPRSTAGHILLATDKFKGSLTAAQATTHLAAGLRRAAPALGIRTIPVADGGEGTVEAAVEAGFARVLTRATGPTGEPLEAAFAVRADTAVIEVAEASGLRRLPHGEPAPLSATSYGTGQLIRAALQAGCTRIILGLGGSACTDGGAGLAQALGARLLDAAGNELPPGGAALARLASIDLTNLAPINELIIASDVDNPLLGPSGAAAIYGPQKGATAEDVTLLNAALANWARVVQDAVAGRGYGSGPVPLPVPGAAVTGGSAARSASAELEVSVADRGFGAAARAEAGEAAGGAVPWSASAGPEVSAAGRGSGSVPVAEGAVSCSASAGLEVSAADRGFGSGTAGDLAGSVGEAIDLAPASAGDRVSGEGGAALGTDFAQTPGAGAAGGIGFGALALFGARLEPGIDIVLELADFAGKAAGARLVITGEGSLDPQSLRGKAPAGVARAAARVGVPVVAVAGVCSLTAAELAAAGIRAAYTLSGIEPELDRCVLNAGPLLERLAADVLAGVAL